MAISFSRPDPSSPAAVAEAAFGTARRGFDQQEVRDFLRMVAAELARLQERERFLERELRSTQAGRPAELDDETVTRFVGEETTRILQTARESSMQIKARAEEGAARVLREATEDAQRQREEADLESARRRNDAAADAEAELAMAKQQGREMVEEARAYRERVLGELARRRDLARQQIEQLIHGRDRLLQAFERARLVAVDVVSELSPLSGPDEYVDLTPTTGPVPVMVPASLIDGRPPDAADALVDAEGTDLVVDETVTMAVEVGELDGSAAPGIYDLADEPAEPDEPDDPEPRAATGPADPTTAGPAAGHEIDVTATADALGGASAPVVALFPDGVPAVHDDGPDEAADATRDDEIDDDDVTAADVDVLFARLRAERSSGAAEPDDSGSPADVTPARDDAAPDDDVEETPFERRDAILVPLIVASARKLKRVLADEQNEVLDTLRRTEPVRSLDVLVPDEQEHADRYGDAIAGELLAAAESGGDAVGAAAPRELDVGPEGVLAPIRDSLAADLVAPLRERLARSVEEGDGDNDTIARRVRSVYREWKTKRIDEQLDDLLRLAHGRGGFAALEPGTPVLWTLDPGEAACADCEDNSLAGAVAAGDAFPTGHTCAPAHAGCRCLLRVAG